MKSIINTIISFKAFLPLFGLILVFVIIRILPEIIIRFFHDRKHKKWLSSQKTLFELIKLRPEEFEDYIGILLEKLGYNNVKVIGGVHQADGGFDVRGEKNGQLYYVQVKKYGLNHPVRVEQVRAFSGALTTDHPNAKGIFVTTSFFTYSFFHSAENFAKRAGIELIDGRKLIEMIKKTDY